MYLAIGAKHQFERLFCLLLVDFKISYFHRNQHDKQSGCDVCVGNPTLRAWRSASSLHFSKQNISEIKIQTSFIVKTFPRNLKIGTNGKSIKYKSVSKSKKYTRFFNSTKLSDNCIQFGKKRMNV